VEMLSCCSVLSSTSIRISQVGVGAAVIRIRLHRIVKSADCRTGLASAKKAESLVEWANLPRVNGLFCCDLFDRHSVENVQLARRDCPTRSSDQACDQDNGHRACPALSAMRISAQHLGDAIHRWSKRRVKMETGI